MRGGRADTTIRGMESIAQCPQDAAPAVLVVYANAGIALALAARLVDHAVVTLASPVDALDALQRGGRIDVVVLCPYLDRVERAAVRAAIAGRERPVAWVQLVDAPERAVARLGGATDQTPAEARALGQILDSLAE